MNDNFKLYSQYYDLLYQDKDYLAETKYIDHLIKTYKPNGKSILELGAGTGKHAFLLADNGYQVCGLERSSDMVAIANKTKQTNPTFELADITDFNLNRSFDIATSLFHVISYLTNTKSLIQTFNNVYNHLNEGGLFIFDVWHSPAVQYQIPEKRIKTLKNAQIEIVREANPTIYPEHNVVEIDYDITITNLQNYKIDQLHEKHPMRHFSRPEIEILAYATGFKIIRSEAFLTTDEPSVHTWGVCYILMKTHDEPTNPC